MFLHATRPMDPHPSQVTTGSWHDFECDNDPAVAGFLAALDVIGNGGAVLNQEGRVIAANAKARSYLGQVPALRNGKISGIDRSSTEVLQRLLARVLHTSLLGDRSATGPILLKRCDGAALIAYASRCGPGERVLIILIDPNERREPIPFILQQLFGLTAAETRIAIELVRGRGMKGIAAALHVAEATVRTQLKSILAKTDTHRQAELVGLLARIGQANLSPTPPVPRTHAVLEPNGGRP
jgi:DNA-binding CsgD family transcriptional regulator